MELNRRNFIKFLVGGAAGIQLTPLPWKLTDDIAIWTQNWPWVPVPPVGEFIHEKSVCTLCPGGCGIEVRRVDDRAVKIEGRTDYPVNPGGICPLGMGGLQLLYNESIRFTRPMKRVGPRGSGIFKDIPWEEALSILAGRISGLRKKEMPEALVAVDGNPARSTLSLLIERLTKAVGSPNYVRIPCVEDTYGMANFLMQGTSGPMAYDLENADFVLSFGGGLLEGWGSPGRVINAWGLWHGNSAQVRAKIVQVESRASNTASKADRWIAARPGTEAALALGLCHVIIKDGLYDREFVNQYSFGFDDFTSEDGKDHEGFKTTVLKKYAPDRVEKITGVSSDAIASLAREFAGAQAPVAVCGKGKGSLSGSLYEFMAVNSLNAIAGRMNKPGGVLIHDPLPLSSLPEIGFDDISARGVTRPRLDSAAGTKYPFSASLINNLAEAIKSSPDSKVDTLLVFAANPVYTLPDGGAFRKALNKVPFIVSFSPFRDETANMADLILPDHTYLEKTEDVVWPSGLQYPLFGLSRPVLEPVYDTKNTGDVLLKLAKKIGGCVESAFPWKRFEDLLKDRAKGLFYSGGGFIEHDGAEPAWKRLQKGPGSGAVGYASFEEMWKKIVSGGMWYRLGHSYKNWDSLFKTPSGKFEFFSTNIERAVSALMEQGGEEKALKDMKLAVEGDEVFMPHYEEPPSDTDRSTYPLVMLPFEIVNLSSTWVPNPPFLNKGLLETQLRGEESFVEINPKTAAQYNLEQGDRIIIKSPEGQIRVRANLFEGAMPGVLFLPLGLGHTAYDEFSKGKGVNPNDIIHAGKDPLSGYPVWWNTPVQIIKV